MGRRRSTSLLDDALEILSWLFSHIPPWLSIPVAMVGLFLFPALMIAQVKTPEFKPADEIFGWLVGGIWAVVWLAGGIGGWIARRRMRGEGSRKASNRGKSIAPRRFDSYSQPLCPECGSSMEVKRAQRGKHAGSEFWGCSQYPRCKGIVNLDEVSS
jgi:Topoisomerase DNA binding C4 zinc finger